MTKFTCGGLAVGICFSHMVFDGQGAAQFLKAAGEMARGLPAPSVAPVWDRDAIPGPPPPPKLPRGGPPPLCTAFSFVTQVVDILRTLLTAIILHFDRQFLRNRLRFTLYSIHMLFISNKFYEFWMSCDCRSRYTKIEAKWEKT